MRLEKNFVVRAPVEAVWAFLTDPWQVAACLPGAAITGKVGEAEYAGTITVKVGPISSSYRGHVRFDRLDAIARVAEIQASGKDVRGKGGAELRMTSRVSPGEGGMAAVSVEQELAVTGLLAQLGRGMLEEVGDQMADRFIGCIRERLESAAASTTEAAPAGDGPPPAAQAEAPPIDAVAMGVTAAWRIARRRQGLVWGLAIAAALLAWWLL